MVMISLNIVSWGNAGTSNLFDETFANTFDYHPARWRTKADKRLSAILDLRHDLSLPTLVRHLFTHGYPDIATRVQAFLHAQRPPGGNKQV
jgi:hypothetical protein